MCGIAGFLSREKVCDHGTLERAAASLRHRGPDTRRCWVAADGLAGLAHARLSIIDLVTGDQPIANEDGSCRIVANGEFYDYERLQRELEGRGHQLATRSDSEVALHLYEERGAGCLEDLRGEFAFAIWDEREQRLFAARDRFGIKPFYYTMQNGTLFFASEIKALAAAGVRLEWDHEAVGQNLYANVAVDRTLFRGVRQLPPGAWLMATREGVRVETYWDLNYPKEGAAVVRTEAEWIEQVREQVVEAVRLRLRADVPVGCLLSGGLDSSSALGIARSLTQGSLKAFTIAFDEAAYDESARAEATAREMGAEFLPIRVTNTDFASVFSDAVWHGEGVHYNGHAAARYILSRTVSEAGIKVVLAGEGGDELTAGYRFCERTLGVGGVIPSPNWSNELLAVLAEKAPSPAKIAAQVPALLARTQALGFPSSLYGNMTGKIAVANGVIERGFAERWCGADAGYGFFRQFDVAGQLNGREPVKQALYLWMKSGFVNYVLAAERLDMAHAVEQRLPFLDHKLFETIKHVPASLLWRDGREKWVLREALKPFVSQAVYAAKKQPFSAPRSALRNGSALLTLAQDLLRSEAAASVPFFDRAALSALVDRLNTLPDQERTTIESTVLMLMSVVVLQQRYRLGG